MDERWPQPSDLNKLSRRRAKMLGRVRIEARPFLKPKHEKGSPAETEEPMFMLTLKGYAFIRAAAATSDPTIKGPASPKASGAR